MMGLRLASFDAGSATDQCLVSVRWTTVGYKKSLGTRDTHGLPRLRPAASIRVGEPGTAGKVEDGILGMVDESAGNVDTS